MSHFNDLRYIEHERSMNSAGGLVLGKDRQCRHCGYDLSGLRYGGKCPECGVAIRYSTFMDGDEGDRLLDVSPLYSRAMCVALSLVALGWLGFAALPIYVERPAGWLLLVGFVGSICWILGVLALIAPRPSSEKVQRSASNGLIRHGVMAGPQILWFAAALFMAKASMSSNVAWTYLAVVVTALAFFGAIGGAWLVAEFADWMGDADTARWLRVLTPWYAMAVTIVLLNDFVSFLPVSAIRVFAILIFEWVIPPVVLLCHLVMTWKFGQVAVAAGWSGILGEKHRERDTQLAERIKRENQEREEQLARQPYVPDGPKLIPVEKPRW